MTEKEIREGIDKAVAEMRALVELSEREGRGGVLSAEEDQKFNALHEEQKKLERQLERRKIVEAAEKKLEQSITPGSPPALENRSGFNKEEREKKYARAFDAWVRHGAADLKDEYRQLLASRRIYVGTSELPEEVRAQGVGTGSGGGYLVPEGFSGEFDRALKAFGGIRQVARMFPTPSGNDIPWPTVDDTANTGELLGENVAAAELDVAFGQVVLKSFKYSSKVVLVSMELLQDSFFDIGSILTELLAERIGRITNTHFTTGTGSGQPQGVVTASGLGKTGASGQTTTLIQEDIIDLEHSVDPLYRPGCSYMLADSTLKAIKKLKDSTGRWLFQANNEASLAAGNQGPNINGYPFTVNQDIAAMTASAKSVLFGNFSKYVVRDVREFALLRLQERYAEKGQVGFIAFTRHDGRAINAAAIKHYINAAS